MSWVQPALDGSGIPTERDVGPPKRCSNCGIIKPRSRFNRDRYSRDGKVHQCKECQKTRFAAYYEQNSRRLIEDKKRYQHSDEVRRRQAEIARRSRARVRAQAIREYGGECVCCGETESRFLTIDHVNDDGAEHRRELGGNSLYWLKRNGWPKDGFQLLCFNCNCGRAINGGVCPHERANA